MQRHCYNLYPISSWNAVTSICTHNHQQQQCTDRLWGSRKSAKWKAYLLL